MSDTTTDAPADDASESEDPASKFYTVDPNYKPVTTGQTGSQRTDYQGAHDVTKISGAFAKAYRRSVLTAKSALDPADPTPASHVTFPEEAHQDHESVSARLMGLFDKVKSEVGFGVDDAFAASSDRSPAAMDRAKAAVAPDEAPEASGAPEASPEAVEAPEDGEADGPASKVPADSTPPGSAKGAPAGEPAGDSPF